MNRMTLWTLVAVFGLAVAAEAQEAAKPSSEAAPALESKTEKVSYAIGQRIGDNLLQHKGKIDLPSVILGMQDRFNDKEPKVPMDEQAEVIEEFSMQRQQEMMKERQEQAQANLKKAQEFLEENKEKEGVKVADSGLQYVVLKEGDGPKPKPEDTIKANYRGTLIDGSEFDNSYDRGEPMTITLGNLIPGFVEGLQLMSPGAKYKFFIPPDLAYGERSPSPDIPPNSLLIFEVELLDVEPPPSATEPGQGRQPSTETN